MLNVKKDFPIFKNNKNLTYLDSAATSQKPQVVIDAISDYYENTNANVHRGIHKLSEKATDMYEESRKKVADFIGANIPQEIIFTRNTTASLNMVAFTYGFKLKKEDVIIVVESDHHSNLVPWQVISGMTGAEIKVLPVNETGELDINGFKEVLDDKVKLVAISHASNVLGTVFPVKEVSKLAHEVGAVVVVDGAQAIPHMEVNVESLGCDFYAFSAHKMLGPMGVGVLWGRKELLDGMSPYQFGGGMIDEVTTTASTYASVPERFEAGTPNVSGAIGLSAAIDYLNDIGMDKIREHEVSLTSYALEELSKVDGLTILGPLDAEKRSGLVSFVIDGIHSHDIAAVLSEKDVAVRSGQHCTMPLHDKFGISSSTRASFYIYNDEKDVDALVKAVKEAKELLS